MKKKWSQRERKLFSFDRGFLHSERNEVENRYTESET